MKESNTQFSENEQNFNFATSLIKVVVFVIALMVMVISKYAFIFFAASMLPTIMAIFIDKGKHRCASATICAFNLAGTLPYLVKLWESDMVNSVAKFMIADVSTWMIVYGASGVGMLLYLSLPLLVVKLYEVKIQMQLNKLQEQYNTLSNEWDIKKTD